MGLGFNGCRRCSDCGINYPLTSQACRRCGGGLSYVASSKPDEDWKEASEAAPPGERADEDARRYDHNLMRLLDMGVPLGRAVELAAERDIVARVRELTSRGCPPATAAEIVV